MGSEIEIIKADLSADKEPKIENPTLNVGSGSKIRTHPQALLILLFFLLLASLYSLATPPFEAGDESRHYAVVKYMADTGRLPIQEPGEAQIHWSHEGNQPPLYYALAAALTFWIETGDWDDVFWYNPHTTIGNPLRPDNKNITIHPPEQTWPWRSHVLAVHLIRFLSIFMATVTVLAAYAIAFSLFRGNRWLAAGAMAITAFNPMYIFISASVNNDNAVIMFISLALWLMVWLGNRQKVTWRSAALLGLLIGLGALSKLYALGLIPLAALLFLWLAYRHTARLSSSANYDPSHFLTSRVFWRTFFLYSLIMLLVILLVAGWFYLRNTLLYNGDVLALQIMRDTAGQRDAPPDLATIQAEFKGFRIAYWALFGGVNILADDWVYLILDWLSLVAALGVIAFIVVAVWLRRRRDKFRISPNAESRIKTIHPPTFILLLLWYLIMMAGFIGWNLTQPAGQGRLLYPAIAAISALGMLGLTWWLSTRWQQRVVYLCIAGLFLFALLSPFLYIIPAYTIPPILTEADLPANMQPVDFIYDDKIRLLGYQLHANTVRPAETLPLTLYWEVLAETDLNYSIFVHLLGRQREVIGQVDTYPGGGHWPTTLLAPGDILTDYYEIPVIPEAELEHAPSRLRLAAGIYDVDEPGRPGKRAINASGEPVETIIAEAKLVPWQWPEMPTDQVPINFADRVTLAGYQIAPNQSSLALTWQVNQPLETDYTIFIQAWRLAPESPAEMTPLVRPESDQAEYITGFDGPPLQGDYPTTYWAPGEVIVDTHLLDLTALPPADYILLVGLYDPATGNRLPAFSPDGPLPDHAVKVGRLQIGTDQHQIGNKE